MGAAAGRSGELLHHAPLRHRRGARAVLPPRAALAEALERDETLAEAHAANAYIRAYYDWDWRGAEREFRRAIELRPSYADAYFSYSRFLASRRRLDEAIAQLGRGDGADRSRSGCRRTAPPLITSRAGTTRRTPGFAQCSKRTPRRTGPLGAALVAEQEGRPDDAIALLERVAPPATTGRLRSGTSMPESQGEDGRGPEDSRRAARGLGEELCTCVLVRAGLRRARPTRRGARATGARVRGALDSARLPAHRPSACAAAPGASLPRPGPAAEWGGSRITLRAPPSHSLDRPDRSAPALRGCSPQAGWNAQSPLSATLRPRPTGGVDPSPRAG